MTGKVLIPLLLATAARAERVWVFEPGQSLVSVEIGHISATSTSVKGTVRELDDGTVEAEVRLAASSFTTGRADRDRKIDKGGEIVFEGRAPKRGKDHMLHLKGTITIRGVSRPIEIPVQVVGAGGRAFAHTSFLLGSARVDVDAGLHPENGALASRG